ncbi:hypothetical protein EVAR_78933_1 [Eumeta japonica]|uniref:Uncharacterized protein n=1 Tax=Eumeta variegata TaxID=151549 RepID=A0A4C1U3C3_EUMVA|nr:hypothetical protein EVAR_78933_1 [Eumeta japonica]
MEPHGRRTGRNRKGYDKEVLPSGGDELSYSRRERPTVRRRHPRMIHHERAACSNNDHFGTAHAHDATSRPVQKESDIKKKQYISLSRAPAPLGAVALLVDGFPLPNHFSPPFQAFSWTVDFL